MLSNKMLRSKDEQDCKTVKSNFQFFNFLKRNYLAEIEIVLFGFALVLGNRNITWNKSLEDGFNSYLFNLLFVGSAYVCLCLCMGEMTSALPFSGGIFGFVRAAAGPYFGYVTAWFEIAFILTYIIIKVDQVLQLMVALEVITTDFIPYAALIFYTSSFALNVVGGKAFWSLVGLLGFGTFCLYLVYLGGAADASVRENSLNFGKYGDNAIPITMTHIMMGRTSINGFYQGLHFIPLLSDSVKNPREQIPRALVVCSVVFVVMSVFLSLSACSQFPGILKVIKAKYPLKYGFAHVFHLSEDDALWFNAPGMYAVAFCLFYCAGKQIHAISKSGLLFKMFSVTTPVLDTPYLSYWTACMIGVGLNVYVFHYPDAYGEIRNVAVLASHIVFFIAFVTYILFKLQYSSLTRSFTSPLGIWGAVYGMLNYFIGIVGIVFYSNETNNSVWALLSLFGFVSLFFWLYMVKYQQFSEEEKKLMFKAYLINANRDKRTRLQKMNKGKASGASKGSTNINGTSCPRDTQELIRPAEFCNEIIPEEPCESIRFPAASHRRVPAPSLDQIEDQFHLRNSISVRLAQFVSGKMNAVAPSGSMKSASQSNKENQQMIILASGGILTETAEFSLQEKLGVDIEASGDSKSSDAVQQPVIEQD